MNLQKILVTTSSYPKGAGDASGVFVEELSKRLTGDFEVFVLAPYSKGSLKTEFKEEVRISRFKYWPGKNLLADGAIMASLRKNKWLYFQVIPFLVCQLFALKKIIKTDNIGIIHAHWLIPQGFVAVIYKRLFHKSIRIFGTIHGSDLNGFKNRFGRFLLKFVLKNIDELSVVSNSIKEDVKKLGYAKEVFVYPMGVDTTIFHPGKKDPDFKQKLGIKGNCILFVGSIIEAKGIRHLIQAMPLVLRELPETALLVVGDGNLKEEMKQLAHQLVIAQNVIFTGKIPHSELPPYFASADVFVLPSFSEGFGLVVAEALSSGTLTIASNLKPINDIIIEGETGFYLADINPPDIAERIIFVLKNQNDFQSIKEKGRKHIVDNFGWPYITKNYRNLIKTI